MPTKVYQYGLLPPTENAALVHEQLRHGHEYRNELTALARERRAAMRELMREHGADQLAALTSAVEGGKAELAKQLALIKRLRSKTRKRTETKAQRDAVGQARIVLREARSALAEERRRMNKDEAFVLARDQLNDEFKKGEYQARAEFQTRGSYWGTRQLADMAVDEANKAPLWDGTEPHDPAFARWRGEGRLGVQVQGGMSAAELFTTESLLLKVDPVDERAWYSPQRSERRRRARTVLRMRITSQDRSPVWAAWPMIMHRPLPDGAIVKRAAVSLRRSGPRERWLVDMTVSLPEHHAVEPGGTGPVGVDLGWRVIGDELRVAAWYGGDGQAGELRLGGKLVSSLRYDEQLRRARDRNLEAMRPQLAAWLAEHTLPEWLTEASRTLPSWRSARRFAGLARRWAAGRFDGDESGYRLLEGWRYQDHHLWQWENDQRSKSLRHRRELYRRFAATLARQYGTLVLEDLDLRVFARRARPENAAENQTARSNRQLVATSELRDALSNAFASRGGAEKREPPEYTTRDCHACGSLEVFDQAAEIQHRCSKCGTLWDQDDNAAKNLVARCRERLSGKKRPQGARKQIKRKEKQQLTETKWQRVERLKQEKEARRQAARQPAPTPP